MDCHCCEMSGGMIAARVQGISARVQGAAHAAHAAPRLAAQ